VRGRWPASGPRRRSTSPPAGAPARAGRRTAPRCARASRAGGWDRRGCSCPGSDFSATLSRLNRRRPSGTSATPSFTRSAASTGAEGLAVEGHLAVCSSTKPAMALSSVVLRRDRRGPPWSWSGLQRENTRCLVLDLRLTGMSGLDLLRQRSRTPIFLLSSLLTATRSCAGDTYGPATTFRRGIGLTPSAYRSEAGATRVWSTSVAATADAFGKKALQTRGMRYEGLFERYQASFTRRIHRSGHDPRWARERPADRARRRVPSPPSELPRPRPRSGDGAAAVTLPWESP